MKAPLLVAHALHDEEQDHKAWKVLNEVDASALNRVLTIEPPEIDDIVCSERLV
jgi:hypothetical protein